MGILAPFKRWFFKRTQEEATLEGLIGERNALRDEVIRLIKGLKKFGYLVTYSEKELKELSDLYSYSQMRNLELVNLKDHHFFGTMVADFKILSKDELRIGTPIVQLVLQIKKKIATLKELDDQIKSMSLKILKSRTTVREGQDYLSTLRLKFS